MRRIDAYLPGWSAGYWQIEGGGDMMMKTETNEIHKTLSNVINIIFN